MIFSLNGRFTVTIQSSKLSNTPSAADSFDENVVSTQGIASLHVWLSSSKRMASTMFCLFAFSQRMKLLFRPDVDEPVKANKQHNQQKNHLMDATANV
jgi:hypothetical protein